MTLLSGFLIFTKSKEYVFCSYTNGKIVSPNLAKDIIVFCFKHEEETKIATKKLEKYGFKYNIERSVFMEEDRESNYDLSVLYKEV